MTTKSIRLAALTVFLLTLLTAGCAGRIRKSEHSLESGGAERVQAEIEMAAGELRIDGGADQLADVTLQYSDPSARPIVDYTVNGTEGHLNIWQDNVLRTLSINERNAWLVNFNDEVPLELKVSLGAGEGKLKLGALTLRRLEVNNGAGNLELDLRGDWQRDLDARIEGGAGEVTIHLPEDVGVRVNVSQGIGQVNMRGLTRQGSVYISDHYSAYATTMELDVVAGVGRINLYAEGA